jgi:protein SCO1/2
MRGWVIHAFSEVGLPREALPFVLEELESGHDPYLAAAAARALRGSSEASDRFRPFVERALENVRGADDRVCFESYGLYALPGQGTTATRELTATLAWIEGSASTADCCAPLGRVRPDGRGAARAGDIDGLTLEDQDGREVTFGGHFRGRPTIALFFYTRCDNPRKCSLSIAKLARVQALLAAEGLLGRIRTAAITYDPAFDVPSRLRTYAQARGLRLDEDHRVLRSTTTIDPLREAFALGVGFMGSLVNRHRTEVYVLDANAEVAASFTRLEWREEDVVARAKALVTPGSARTARSAVLSVLATAAVAALPKCPLCWAAYMSVLGVAGLERSPLLPWLLPSLVGLMVLGVASAWLRARRGGSLVGLGLLVAGCAIVLGLGVGLELPGARGVGVALCAVGALVGSVPRATAGRAPPRPSGSPARPSPPARSARA